MIDQTSLRARRVNVMNNQLRGKKTSEIAAEKKDLEAPSPGQPVFRKKRRGMGSQYETWAPSFVFFLLCGV
jgi:hypothetical protein